MASQYRSDPIDPSTVGQRSQESEQAVRATMNGGVGDIGGVVVQDRCNATTNQTTAYRNGHRQRDRQVGQSIQRVIDGCTKNTNYMKGKRHSNV